MYILPISLNIKLNTIHDASQQKNATLKKEEQQQQQKKGRRRKNNKLELVRSLHFIIVNLNIQKFNSQKRRQIEFFLPTKKKSTFATNIYSNKLKFPPPHPTQKPLQPHA